MEKIKEFLISLGIGKNESEVYAALTMYGTSSVLEISRKTNLHRSNIYDSLNELIRRGIVFKEGDSKTEIAKELGDVLWYLSCAAYDLEIALEDIAIMNINKLADRKERNKLGGSGDHR